VTVVRRRRRSKLRSQDSSKEVPLLPLLLGRCINTKKSKQLSPSSSIRILFFTVREISTIRRGIRFLYPPIPFWWYGSRTRAFV
jgi:hypothetical protein